jgi:hypothetical protein
VEKPGGNKLLRRSRCKLRIVLKSTFKHDDKIMGWIDLVQDRDRWSSLLNAVQNNQLLKMRGISLVGEELSAS